MEPPALAGSDHRLARQRSVTLVCVTIALLAFCLVEGGGSPSARAAATAGPDLVLYAPEMVADDVLAVSGRISHVQDPDQLASVYVYDSSGVELASARVGVSRLGAFTASLALDAGSRGGAQQLYIGASYRGAAPQGLLAYADLVPMAGSFPQPLAQAAASVSKRTAIPVQVPTWIPQPLTVSAPRLPYVSVSGAAKSFTYSLDIRLTPRPYPYGAAAIESDAHPSLAFVQGVRFSDPAAAMHRLHHHLDQVRPALSTRSHAVGLGSGLSGLARADRWHTVLWREGPWILVVRGPNGEQNLRGAREIVRDLDRYALPPADGVVWLRYIAVGHAVTGRMAEIDVSYRQGRSVYSISGLYADATAAVGRMLRLAASMRPWS